MTPEKAEAAKEKREAPIIDAHFKKRKRFFIAEAEPKKKQGLLALKKTKWFVK